MTFHDQFGRKLPRISYGSLAWFDQFDAAVTDLSVRHELHKDALEALDERLVQFLKEHGGDAPDGEAGHD